MVFAVETLLIAYGKHWGAGGFIAQDTTSHIVFHCVCPVRLGIRFIYVFELTL